MAPLFRGKVWSGLEGCSRRWPQDQARKEEVRNYFSQRRYPQGAVYLALLRFYFFFTADYLNIKAVLDWKYTRSSSAKPHCEFWFISSLLSVNHISLSLPCRVRKFGMMQAVTQDSFRSPCLFHIDRPMYLHRPNFYFQAIKSDRTVCFILLDHSLLETVRSPERWKWRSVGVDV